MERYRIEQQDGKTTIWDDSEGVGLRFNTGDTLQRYTSELITTGDPKDVETLNTISEALTEYAAVNFPKEFKPIKI